MGLPMLDSHVRDPEPVDVLPALVEPLLSPPRELPSDPGEVAFTVQLPDATLWLRQSTPSSAYATD